MKDTPKPEPLHCPRCTRVDQITAFKEYALQTPVEKESDRRRVIGYRCDACLHKWAA
ncbi:MAG TPA: hypothetical protein VGM06_18035 [Polyangiaceae bacterium]|jgi:hypothetical protein